MRIAVIGSGRVGGPLAANLQRAGHQVTVAARDPGAKSVLAARGRNADLGVAAPLAAVGQAEVVDATNPVGPGLTHGLGDGRSGAESVQALAPQARVVKAFSIYGFENLEDPGYPGYGIRPAMLFCGEDAAAKEVVGGLIEQLGWEPVDVGGLAQALHLEHMTLMWVRMVRADGGSPGRVWAILRR